MVFHNAIPGTETEDVRKQLDAMRERVNECLPSDIRVLDFERVTRMFCARTNRDKVRYQYLVPTYLLCSREEICKAFNVKSGGDGDDESGAGATSKLTPMEASKIVQDAIDDEVLAKARDSLLKHRVTPEQMELLKSGLKLFEGTKNFHNYTRRVKADTDQASRYILSFKPLDPVMLPGGTNADGIKLPDTQWIPLQVVGQSFLLNQIRKMVSAAVDLARGVVTPDKIEMSLTKECRMQVNVAPAQGLFLDRSFFELYNKHKAKNVADRDSLDWVEKEGEVMPAAGKIDCFMLAQ